MEINYKFDDSKDEHKKGVKKNKFTKDRIHSYDTPEFEPSSGWPDEEYGKDFNRLDSDSPSFEGNYWFVSQNFNDVETNKRPLHPQKDYLNYEDSHTGDDHVEIRGNHKPTDKVSHDENPNSDHENYDEKGKIFMDKKGGQHLMATETVKEETKHIYKEKKNTMKSTMQEQLNRIKQMMLFEEGMSFKDVKSLTEQDEKVALAPTVDTGITTAAVDKGAVDSKGGEKNVDVDSTVSTTKSATKSVPVEKGTADMESPFSDSAEKIDMESPYESPVMNIDSQIKAVNGKIDDVKKAIESGEGDDAFVDGLKTQLEQLQNDLDKLKTQKDSEEKEPGEKPGEEEPGKEEPGKGDGLVQLRTLPLNEATNIESGPVGGLGFPNSVNFTIGETNYSLVERGSESGQMQGELLGNGPNSLNVMYYTLSALPSKGGLTSKASDLARGEKGTAVISTKSGMQSQVFIEAMKSLNISFNTMMVPVKMGGIFDPGDGFAAPGDGYLAPPSAALPAPGDGFAAPVSGVKNEFPLKMIPGDGIAVEMPQAASAYQSQSMLDNPIQPAYSVERGEQGIVVYTFNSQESLDNAMNSTPSEQNQAVEAEILKFRGDDGDDGDDGGDLEPGDGEIMTAEGAGNSYELLFDGDGKIFGSQWIKNLGTGKVTKGGKENELLITFGNATHAKYGKGELKGSNEGTEDIFYLNFITQDGDIANRAKVPFRVSPLKSAKVSSKTTGMKRGSYQAPTFGTRLTSQQPTLNFGTSKSAYDPFSGGGNQMGNVSDLNTADLKSLIDQLQSQLDGEDNDDFKKKEDLNETYRRPKNYRRKPMNRRRLNESSIVSKVKEYGNELQDFAKRKGVPVDELKKGLEGLSTGAVNMSKEIAQAAGEFLGVLVANNEIPKSEVDGLEKNLKESIKRSKNLIKLTEGDLYKIVDRVLREKK